MAAKFDIETKNGFLLIRCDGMIHLMVERPVAIQSWITDEEQEKYLVEQEARAFFNHPKP